MGETTGIDWTDATFNPWIGCSNVSPGCGHCYAKTMSEGRMGIRAWYDEPRHITKAGTWRLPLRWAARARDGLLPNGEPNEDGHRPRVFCASMGDVFEPHPQLEEPRHALFQLIYETPELDWLILTKRPEFMAEWMAEFYDRSGEAFGHAAGARASWPAAPNIWLGTSIENSRYTWRADVLREIPAVVHFISAEPLLGSLYPDRGNLRARTDPAPRGENDPFSPPVDSSDTRAASRARGEHAEPRPRAPLDLTHIEWVIVGGESGPGHRPMNVEHAREIRDAVLNERRFRSWLTRHGTATEAPPLAFFFKQHGGPRSWSGGKLLDGREWCEFPEPTRDLMPA